jgi:hypothetical protein
MEDQACCVSAVKVLWGKHVGPRRWEEVSVKAKQVVDSSRFETAMTLAVVLAAVLVVLASLRTDTNEKAVNSNALDGLNLGVLAIFALEVVLKIVSEGLSPLAYFNDSWNVFDFGVVFVSLAFLLIGGSNVSILRTMRLLQVVKLTKRFRNLRVLIEALLTGFASVGYVMVLISVFNFIFAIAGVNYFLENDGFNFGTVRVAMVTLFRIETLQAWEEVMYVSLLGCDEYHTPGSSSFHEESCKIPQASGYTVLVYYGFVVVFGALVMPSLLVAIITAAVKESDFEAKESLELDQRVGAVVEEYQRVFTEDKVLMYDTLFRFGDKDGSGALDFEEILLVLSHITDFGGAHFNRDLTMQVFLCVDKDNDESIDKAEFFEMVGKILMVVEVLERKGLSFEDEAAMMNEKDNNAGNRRNNIAERAGSLYQSNAATNSSDGSAAALAGGAVAAAGVGYGSSEKVSEVQTAAASTAAAALAVTAAATAGLEAVAPNWPAIVELAEEVLRVTKKEWEAWDRVEAEEAAAHSALVAAAAASSNSTPSSTFPSGGKGPLSPAADSDGGSGGGGGSGGWNLGGGGGCGGNRSVAAVAAAVGAVASSNTTTKSTRREIIRQETYGGELVVSGRTQPLLRRDITFIDVINAVSDRRTH